MDALKTTLISPLIASSNQINITEEIEVGKEIGRVYAKDPDSGENGTVKYSIRYDYITQSIIVKFKNSPSLVVRGKFIEE